ncbi:MAG: hypothetical protein JETT_3403 [Candidatus Jettenia ecosi]|uniref:Uncharacterized protein n=1 Tax=Candidatus Jettenia ecosi TaxID=2494326 RepID=A0A533Q6U8_9BACT|nr:MAG: hypothetical protein JETT_3403 [Candidatus Jettenia ecosi]
MVIAKEQTLLVIKEISNGKKLPANSFFQREKIYGEIFQDESRDSHKDCYE